MLSNKKSKLSNGKFVSSTDKSVCVLDEAHGASYVGVGYTDYSNSSETLDVTMQHFHQFLTIIYTHNIQHIADPMTQKGIVALSYMYCQ